PGRCARPSRLTTFLTKYRIWSSMPNSIIAGLSIGVDSHFYTKRRGLSVFKNCTGILMSCVLAAMCYLSSPDLHGQAVNGTILGIVQDQQGGAIAKADVSARNLETGAVRKTTSEDNGEYRIASIPAGTYEITITAPGFKTEVRSGVAV